MTTSALVPISEHVDGGTVAGPVTAVPAGEFCDLPLSSLRESKTNPRRTFDKKALEELAQSIREKGVLMPILVRSLKGKAFEFEVVAGARRFRAAELAGQASIPARVVDLTDVQVLEVQVIENLQRQDVHPLEEAEGYEALHKKHGYSIDDLGGKVGKSKAYIYARLKYLALGPAGRKAFLAGELSPSTALLVARIPVADLQAQAVKAVTGADRHGDGPMSYRTAADYVQRNFMLRLDDAGFSTTALDLVPAAGSCSACPKRTGNQRELFDDVKSADVCTDPVCFRSKRDASFKLRAQEAESRGLKVIPAGEAKKMFWSHSDHLQHDAQQKYASLDDACYDDRKNRHFRAVLGQAAAANVVLAQNPYTGTVHELIPRSVLPRLLKDAGVVKEARASVGRSTSDGGKWRKQELERQKKAKAESAYRREVLRQVLAKVPSKLEVQELRAIAVGFVSDVWTENHKAVATLLGWEVGKGESAQQVLNRQIEKGTLEQLVQVLMVLAFIRETNTSAYGGNAAPKRLLAIAKHYGVNPDRIRRDLAAAQKAKAPKRIKKAQPKGKGPLARKGGRK
jgi:ParB/RepB/Spo0J family partition protein